MWHVAPVVNYSEYHASQCRQQFQRKPWRYRLCITEAKAQLERKMGRVKTTIKPPKKGWQTDSVTVTNQKAYMQPVWWKLPQLQLYSRQVDIRDLTQIKQGLASFYAKLRRLHGLLEDMLHLSLAHVTSPQSLPECPKIFWNPHPLAFHSALLNKVNDWILIGIRWWLCTQSATKGW
jgi:hypothetical protein